MSGDQAARAILELLSEVDVETPLVVAHTQFLEVHDRELRAQLSTRLFEVARALEARGLASEEPTFFAAVRMAAVFAKPEGLSELGAFLTPDKLGVVQQVSLQAIANVAHRRPLPEIPELIALRRRVAATANRLCQADLLGMEGVAAVAISSVEAARALGLSQVEKWTAAFRSRPLLLRQLVTGLEELTAEWPAEAKVPVAAPPKPRFGARRPRLHIGQEFIHPHTKRVWRVTDVGIHCVVLIDVDEVLKNHGGDRSWLNGPPYAVEQRVWSWFDLGVLDGVEGIEWEDASRSLRTNLVVCPYCGWTDPESGMAYGGDEGTWDQQCGRCNENFVATRIISERVVCQRREA